MDFQDDSSGLKSKRRNCPFYITRKNRYCRMTVGNGLLYCGEHVDLDPSLKGNGQRIPCPYDQRHSCYVSGIESHLKKCNARPLENPGYISKNINKGSASEFTMSRLGDVDAKCLLSLLERVKSVYNELGVFIEEEYLEHEVLNESLSDSSLGPNSRKHLIQNSSLLGHVQKFNLTGKLGVIEFGAGKGQLTYWLCKSLPHRNDCQFMVVDKGTLRHKSENKIKEPSLGNVNRYRADIADVRLSQLPPALTVERCIAISKHLCGVATDLALRCVVNGIQESEQLTVDGIVIAVCCHHRCDWNSYTGKDFLLDNGFEPSVFGVMCGIASWATCGISPRKHAHNHTEEYQNENPSLDVIEEREKRLDLSPEERTVYGQMAKRLLDYGRKMFLEKAGYECILCYYVHHDVSPENVCLRAKLKS